MSTENGWAETELPAELNRLVCLIDEKPEAFASGDKDMRDAALTAVKYIFDLTLKSEASAFPHLKDLLDSIGPAGAPQTRSQTKSTSTKEAVHKKQMPPCHDILNATPLATLFVDGMDDDQVWAQLELKAKNVCDTLDETFAAGDMTERDRLDSSDEGESDDDESEELDSDDLMELARLEEAFGSMDDGGDDDESDKGEGDDESDLEEEEMEEKVAGLRDPSSDEEDSEEGRMDLDAGPSRRNGPRKGRTRRHARLDDNFFSLEDFNAEIEEAETKRVSRGSLSKNSEDSDSEEDDEIDFFRPVNDDYNEPESTGGEAYYKDFFDPPSESSRPRKRKATGLPKGPPKRSKVHFNEQVKVKTIKSKGKGLPLSSVGRWIGDALRKRGDGDDDTDGGEDDTDGGEDDDSLLDGDGDNETENMDDVETDSDAGSRTESETDQSDVGRDAVRRSKDDLFADDDDSEASKSGLSTHEARMEELRRQIAELEAENVAEKDWVLKGEVTSRARPQNALLEEDLEFERVTKAVPVIAEEIVQDLETRIKDRIIEGRFDDVVRKRPVDDKPFLPSQMFELQDTKSKESLAQIYENEYIASQSGGSIDDRDARLQKEHEEIEKQWETICYRLDALCNAHFTPKQPKATISTVSNVSAVSLESPLPTAEAASTVLAPEEVFTPNTSNLRSKSELAPTEKRALRSKEKKKRKKQRQLLEKSVDKFAKPKKARGAKQEKEDALKSLVKSGKGVTVIGKKSQELGKSKRQNATVVFNDQTTIILSPSPSWPPPTMSWFKKNKSQPLIPPVEAPPSLNRGSTSPSSTAPPSYRSSANTYVASRDGDLSDPRAYGNFNRQSSGGPDYGEPNRPNYGRANSDQGYGYSSGSMQPPPIDRYSNRNEYGVSSVVSDPYRRGERDLDADRNALFAGSVAQGETPGNRFYDGPTPSRPAPTPGEENEEDVDEVIQQTRFLKQDTVQTTRNALRIAREAEEVGRSTLLRLGEQSEKIADTERHIDVAKGHALRAEDNADEIKKLNRSIFVPAITFNKDAKRLAQERKREQRFQEEIDERKQTMQELRDSQNRVGRGVTFGQSDGEGISGRRQLTSTELAMRKEQRKRYQFEATESDDEMENEIEDNLDEILDATKRMKALGLSMGAELQTQNERLVRVGDKTDRLGMKVDLNTAKLNRIAR